MDLGGWLRSLGLERYEAAFRENAIAADVLPDLTDQDLEKLGVLLGDRRRLLRAIAALDGAPPSVTGPAPSSSPAKPKPETAAAASVAAAEVSGELPNVVKLRANTATLLKADPANEDLRLENAIRQVAMEAPGKSPAEPLTEARTRLPPATPPAAPARPDRPNTTRTDLPGEGWTEALLSARQRLLKGRSAAKGQAATSLRPDIVDEGVDSEAATVRAPQAAPPPPDTYEPEAGAATAKAPHDARPARDTSSYEPEAPAAGTAKAPQPPPLRRNLHEPETRAAIAKAPPAARGAARHSHEPEARPATGKAPPPTRLTRDSHQPETRPTPAKAPAPARPPRHSQEPETRPAAAKAPQPTRLPRDSYAAEVRSVPAKPARPARPLRDSYESDELRYPPLIEAEPTSPDLELDLEQEDFDLADYDTQHESDLEPAYEFDDEPPVLAPPARHTPRRTAPEEKRQRKRSPLSFGGLARLLAVLLILGGLAAAISWQWSTIADLYQLLSRIGQQLQSQFSGDNPSGEPKFGPRVAQEQAGGQTFGTAGLGGQTTPAVASLIEADPSDPKGKRYAGSVIWRTETLSASPGLAPELAVRADIEIPERRMTMILSMRRNTDKTLPATHTIEMTFNLPADFSGGSIANVAAVVMKQSEEARGNKLVTRVAKVTNGYFLIGLSAVDADAQRDTQLLKDRPWFDIGIAYASGNYAILALEKGEAGNRAFAQAFAAWEKK
jgi:SAM domain (Sterile alpha motif)